MKYITSNWTWQAKDWWQQPLHFLGGALLVMVPCSIEVTLWPVALLSSIAYGMLREYTQHPPVCIDVDSCFWTLGAVVPTLGILL